MPSKYELPFSTQYVPDWTYIEAFRELFQNALDNEIMNPENKMGFLYNEDTSTLSITNKTSVLELDTLLLGQTTKADNEDTIGTHGEGYKIAFLVLLREGKTVTVYNYGKREVWRTKLVKSKRYNNQLVPTILVDREVFWRQVPNDDLTIDVGNVTPDEYKSIVFRNLNLQDNVEGFNVPKMGRILTSSKEKGNVYVKGLFVCNFDKMRYGYDLEPRLVKLDRDRRLISSFDMCWNTSAMWKYAFISEESSEMRERAIELIEDRAEEVTYMVSNSYNSYKEGFEEDLGNVLAERFVNRHGADAVPVLDNDELEEAANEGKKPVLVSDVMSYYIAKANKVEVSKIEPKPKVSKLLKDFLDKIEHKLTDEEVDEFEQILDLVIESVG